MKRLPTAALLGATALVIALPAAAQHRHGVGEMRIALDGSTLAVQLEAPADDLVGFENAPTDDAQRKAVADALSKLRDASMFTPAAAAGCSPAGEPEVELHVEGDHAAFEATHTYECATPAALTAIETTWFDTFSGSKEMEVEALGPGGQTAVELTKGSSSIDLSGIVK